MKCLNRRKVVPGVLLKVKCFNDTSKIHLFNDDAVKGGCDNMHLPRIEVTNKQILIAVSEPQMLRRRIFHVKVLTSDGQIGWANLDWVDLA